MRNAVGLDISAKTFDVVTIINGETDYRKFSNDEQGCKNLKEWISAKREKDIYVCMEATGNYYEQAADCLAEEYHVSVINPLKIKAYAQKRFSRVKNDKQDAKLIAEFCQTALIEELPKREKPTEQQYSLKRLLSLQSQLLEQQTSQKNRIKAAKDSFVQKIHEKQLKELENHLNAVKKKIDQIIKSDKKMKELTKRLETIPSVGKTTAISLMSHLINSTFENAKQFTAYAGLNPQQNTSGTSVNKKSTMTKYGNRRIRGSLFMAALVAFRNNYFPAFTNRLKKAKKPKMLIIGALMRKILVVAFNLYKTETDFDKTRYQTA